MILKEGAQIRGLNTAAVLWCSRAAGAFAGPALPADAVAGHTVPRRLVGYINRLRIDRNTTGAHYQGSRVKPSNFFWKCLKSLEHFHPDCAGRKCSISLFDRMIHAF
jgi:hypothetical protein